MEGLRQKAPSSAVEDGAGNLSAKEDGKLITTVQEAFTEFEKQTARVPDAQNKRAQEVHPIVTDAIKADLGDLFNRAFLAGSYRRKVQAVRLKDVDIIIG